MATGLHLAMEVGHRQNWEPCAEAICSYVFSSLANIPTYSRSQDLAQIALDRAREGKNLNSFANKLYTTRDTHKLSEIEIHLLCGLALEGGSDVVSSPTDRLLQPFSTFFLRSPSQFLHVVWRELALRAQLIHTEQLWAQNDQ